MDWRDIGCEGLVTFFREARKSPTDDRARLRDPERNPPCSDAPYCRHVLLVGNYGLHLLVPAVRHECISDRRKHQYSYQQQEPLPTLQDQHQPDCNEAEQRPARLRPEDGERLHDHETSKTPAEN
jgi:hypothetical protein